LAKATREKKEKEKKHHLGQKKTTEIGGEKRKTGEGGKEGGEGGKGEGGEGGKGEGGEGGEGGRGRRVWGKEKEASPRQKATSKMKKKEKEKKHHLGKGVVRHSSTVCVLGTR
jgi:hypothetical protein